MTILFIFLDGVGLGSDDDSKNPFSLAKMPNISGLLNNQKLIGSSAPFSGERATLLGLDACLGVAGLPQSATGQAVLLTGRNVPAEIGYHYGPKPDKVTAEFLRSGGIFGEISRSGKNSALVNAYPDLYFDGINSGKKLYSAIPLAVINAGLQLFGSKDLQSGRAMSADFTGAGWIRRNLLTDVSVLTHRQAGEQLASISANYDFAFLEYWLTDYAGHKQNMKDAVALLEQFDEVLGSLIEAGGEELFIVITSDHGNMEDLSTRRHTENLVPLLLVGNKLLRNYFDGVSDLTGVYSAIISALGH